MARKTITLLLFLVSAILSLYLFTPISGIFLNLSPVNVLRAPPISLPTLPSFSSCRRNPYLKDWNVEHFLAAAKNLVDFRVNQNTLALDSVAYRHEVGWERFNSTPKFSSCPSLARFPVIDTSMEDGKWLCGIKNLKAGCIVYSLGSNADFNFEYAVVDETPCHVYTFDCTVSELEDRFPKDLTTRGKGRVHFFPWCVGASEGLNGLNYFSLRELAAKLGHAQVDLLKMDVEGYEYRVFQTFFSEALRMGSEDFFPMQVAFEMHAWQPHVSEPATAIRNSDGLSAGDMQIFWTQVSELGYVPISRENNKHFSFGVEFTIIRAFC